MRLLQISDPHLLADPEGLCRGRRPLQQLRHGLQQLLASGPGPVDLLLLSGDLCHDESWLGYCQLRDLLLQLGLPMALLPGNHDHPQLLRAALGRHGAVAPALVRCGALDLVVLDSHRAGCEGGELGAAQLRWLQALLAERDGRPLVVALHHPPLAIGDPFFDGIGLIDGPALLELLRPVAALKAVLFGHIHQHWQGLLPGRGPALFPVLALGCPSTLRSVAAVQPCPLGRADDPGARLLTITPDGGLQQQLLRWSPAAASSLG
ncbi:MAG: 3',5'-cyclic-nucleotide phosphodiesterase [Cyanobacteria bacterium K_Offshore_0m_m2_072]|nr:3',5'-cyclic-nucleotide phosphodiesterase [Cyanobacteria bacterium K_Offshore_0m_m2_072]